MTKRHWAYAPEYRRQMVELVRSGRTPRGLAREFECPASAIRNGVLSDDPDSARYAGHYMYLFHDGAGTAWFKHRDSRVSVTMQPGGRIGGRGRDRA